MPVPGPGGPVDLRRGGRCSGRRVLRLDPRVPRRHRQPQHVGAGAGVAGGDRVGEGGDLRGQHDFRGDDPVEPAEPAGVLAARGPGQQEAVDEPAGEPDAHPHAHPRLGIELTRDQIVELAVEMRQRQQRQDPRHRIRLGGGPVGGHPDP